MNNNEARKRLTNYIHQKITDAKSKGDVVFMYDLNLYAGLNYGISDLAVRKIIDNFVNVGVVRLDDMDKVVVPL